MCLEKIGITRSKCFWIALTSTVVYFLFWAISAITDGNWHFGEMSMSDLGISDNPISAFFFNAACIISGLLAVIHGYLWFHYGKDKCRIGGMSLALSGLFLALIGVFTLRTYDAHNTITICMSIFACLAIAIGFVNDLNNRRIPYLAFTLVIAIIFAVCSLTLKFELVEPINVSCSLIWIPVNGYKVSKGLYDIQN